MNKHDVIIIGGGAVGSAIAWRLSRYDADIAVLEKNHDVAMGTSGKNSAVAHAGFNNKPGSLMAELCVKGNEGFEKLCADLDVPYKKTGKLVVGFDDTDKAGVEEILENGRKNHCKGLRAIDKEQIRELEPSARGEFALYSPNTAVMNPFLYNIHLAEAALGNGVTYYLESGVTSIRKAGGSFILEAGGKTFSCDILINAAGLYADEVAAMAGDTGYKIYPCRGQYYILDKKVSSFLHMPVYPVPRKGLGGLGVHLTPTIDGNVLIGPSAEYVDDKEEYSTTAEVARQLLSEAGTLMPSVSGRDIIGGFNGIRAKLVAKGQENYGDFIIEKSAKVENMIQLVGIESPGLTSSAPIADYVLELLDADRRFTRRKDYKATYRGQRLFRDMSREEQNRMIAEDPRYGQMICRCENVTKADVIRALENPLGARSVISVKNRVRAMMGRCQGGHCFARIVEIMEEELNAAPEELIYRTEGDRLFMGDLK